MALKAVLVSDVPNLDHVSESPTTLRSSSRLPLNESARESSQSSKFTVIGHRGKGMNTLASPDPRLKIVKENTVLSFNEAGRFPVDFVEFDVQVTKDGCPVVFHDNFILTDEGKRVTDLHLENSFLTGPRKIRARRKMFSWNVEHDDPLCTLQEVFLKVHSRLGFNIELKFDDHVAYGEEELVQTLQTILRVVFELGNERPILFSSFHPDAAHLMRKLQSKYPVFFLTNGGNEAYSDERRNSLDEAIKHCVASQLHGIVSEVRGVFRNPSLIPRIKEFNLCLLTYGQLNNVAEAVYMQHLMGIDGVIVDLVQEITEAVSDFAGDGDDDSFQTDADGKQRPAPGPSSHSGSSPSC
ncbi:unnamed protein product [Spirodela intermedia]|uniref:glycerophosphodiester phosphodiesterase n=1 Tax=Spirodela intermedia TaxID=51605 RepID=A0A7I8IQ40_SPIIN|nr:unnamed protein product [Spirodela intermedia]CAA6660000.1 unnamed protein product [Spirodela intermedia]